MECTEIECRGRRPRCAKAMPRFLRVVAILAVLGSAVAVGFYYRYHLQWLFEKHRLGLQAVKAIPDSAMPDALVPETWIECRVGRLLFSLPSDLATNMVAQQKEIGTVTFGDDTRTVIVVRPTDAIKCPELTHAGVLSECSTQGWTLPRLRLACYRTSSDTFRWSMTPQEARYFAFTMVIGTVIRSCSVKHAEYFFRDDLEAIALFFEDRVVLDWASKQQAIGGNIHFVDSRGGRDSTWIRAACQSMKLSMNDEH